MKYKNHPSLYESYYNIWNGIDFDKDKLIKFIKRIRLLSYTSIFYFPHKEELKQLKKIKEQYDINILKGLLNNDETISKNAFIDESRRKDYEL